MVASSVRQAGEKTGNPIQHAVTLRPAHLMLQAMDLVTIARGPPPSQDQRHHQVLTVERAGAIDLQALEHFVPGIRRRTDVPVLPTKRQHLVKVSHGILRKRIGPLHSRVAAGTRCAGKLPPVATGREDTSGIALCASAIRR
jgi:hypothetical protein